MAEAGAAGHCALTDVIVAAGPAIASELAALGAAGFRDNVVLTADAAAPMAIAGPGVAVLVSDPYPH
jgi:hypothetical protein